MNYPYPDSYQNPQAYWQAARRVRAKMNFYWHLAVYLGVNSFLFGAYVINSLAINWFGYPWFLWPLGVWGFFLVLRFLRVFVFPDSPDYRQYMISRELERMPYPAPPVYPAQAPVTNNNHHHTGAGEEVMANKGNL